VVALANGEIYNHLELRRRLQEDGALDIPESDCGPLGWMWKRHGKAFLPELVGMFALALWDGGQQTLLLARDRAGQKPLYVSHLPGGGIAFASEPKALLLHPEVSREIDPIALRQFLSFDFVPGTRTIYRAIQKLAPGTSLLWSANGSVEETFFEPPTTEPRIEDLETGAERLWEALAGSVRRRLMADVPLGVFLSGGLDSAAVVSAMCSVVDPGGIHTFSIGFEDPAFDESSHAKRVANLLGTQHHEKKLSSREVLAQLPHIMATLDEPFADASYVPTYLLSAFAAQSVKVVLGGDGGDELFLGYPTFYAEGQVAKAKRMPRLAREKMLLPLVSLFSNADTYMPSEFKWRRFLRGLDRPRGRRHVGWIGGIDARDHGDLLQGDYMVGDEDAVFAPLARFSERFRAVNPGADPLEELAYQYFASYLADGVLQKVDRASMAHSLEVRSPFLDPSVMGVAARLSLDLKLRGKETKRVLRRALRGKVDPATVGREKQGFALPVGRWLRDDLKPWLCETLDPSAMGKAGIFQPRAVEALIGEHMAGKRSRHKELWTLLSFETWRRGPHGPGG
jgi:asparagine synthase (glutamine-hydrolysing)